MKIKKNQLMQMNLKKKSEEIQLMMISIGVIVHLLVWLVILDVDGVMTVIYQNSCADVRILVIKTDNFI